MNSSECGLKREECKDNLVEEEIVSLTTAWGQLVIQMQKNEFGPLYYNIYKVKVTQSYPTLCDPMDYTVQGILQARILE